MGELVEAIIVGVLQGLTEFIPVSSSAHLTLAPWLFGFGESRVIGTLAFDVFLHLGTMVALLIYFARDWVRLARAWFASLRDRRIGDDADRRLAWLLIAATIPAGIIGLTFEDFIEQTFHGDSTEARLAIAGALTVGGIALWLADRYGRRHRRLEGITLPVALTIGFSQALALMPGISRSGATITAGLALGLTRETAARFSFLLATPITLGAGLYGSRRLFEEALTTSEWVAIAAGFAASMLAGLLAIGFLLAWLRRRSVAVFSLYRIAFAATIVWLVIAGR
ncbi:MAG TPA: undecaprenyl-diphosphate phosphatase [Candidatus Limnocylindrales bacterium]|jgi:undecaprenyl-diphosphatase|nr:undecaprenyl-diphosphate phosphatase [Candidatus Limnocylindrales bacterium]